MMKRDRQLNQPLKMPPHGRVWRCGTPNILERLVRVEKMCPIEKADRVTEVV
jgi:hypothetical protein